MARLLFLLLAAFWGGSFVAIKFVVHDFPPLFGAMLRVGLATLVLAALFKAQRRDLSAPAPLRRRMWLAGLFAQGVPFCFLFWGERHISPGLAGIINGTVPLWALVLGLFSADSERPAGRKLAGLVLGFLGIVAVFGPLVVFGGTRAEILGTGAVVFMAVCYGIGSLLSKSILSGKDKADFRANIYHQHLASFAFLVLASALLERWPSPGLLLSSPPALAAVVYLGVFSTAIAFLIYFHLLREWGVARASAVTYVSPLFALGWDFLFFGRVPRASEFVGAAAILSGVVLLHSAKD